MRFEVGAKDRNARKPHAPPPYKERVRWCGDMTGELVRQLEACADGRSARIAGLRHRVHTLQVTLTSHLHSTQQLLAHPPRDPEAARVRCMILVHESGGLESECHLLQAEAGALLRHWKEEGLRRGDDEDGEGREEVDMEEVECSGLLEKLKAHDVRRKLLVETGELEATRVELEEWVGRVLERRFAAGGSGRRVEDLAVGVV